MPLPQRILMQAGNDAGARNLPVMSENPDKILLNVVRTTHFPQKIVYDRITKGKNTKKDHNSRFAGAVLVTRVVESLRSENGQ